ncbi:MAG: hypothetical protein HY727_07230 [Candidatus Rokubacteria bacterium]|nr:hypothetical protein [Candidatus Rokubacteria bacterium]
MNLRALAQALGLTKAGLSAPEGHGDTEPRDETATARRKHRRWRRTRNEMAITSRRRNRP